MNIAGMSDTTAGANVASKLNGLGSSVDHQLLCVVPQELSGAIFKARLMPEGLHLMVVNRHTLDLIRLAIRVENKQILHPGQVTNAIGQILTIDLKIRAQRTEELKLLAVRVGDGHVPTAYIHDDARIVVHEVSTHYVQNPLCLLCINSDSLRTRLYMLSMPKVVSGEPDAALIIDSQMLFNLFFRLRARAKADVVGFNPDLLNCTSKAGNEHFWNKGVAGDVSQTRKRSNEPLTVIFCQQFFVLPVCDSTPLGKNR